MTAATTSFALTRIGQIAMNAKDIDRAVAFYRDVLGMRFLFQAPPALAFFDCGGVRLMLTGAAGAEGFEHHGSILYYKVDDIDAAHESLVSRGVVFDEEPHLIARMPDHDLWIGSFKDSEGNTLAIMCEKRK
jgi:predicted enzyme related to lactoylglutathione lyase